MLLRSIHYYTAGHGVSSIEPSYISCIPDCVVASTTLLVVVWACMQLAVFSNNHDADAFITSEELRGISAAEHARRFVVVVVHCWKSIYHSCERCSLLFATEEHVRYHAARDVSLIGYIGTHKHFEQPAEYIMGLNLQGSSKCSMVFASRLMATDRQLVQATELSANFLPTCTAADAL